jgi:hypothetical protein
LILHFESVCSAIRRMRDGGLNEQVIQADERREFLAQ